MDLGDLWQWHPSCDRWEIHGIGTSVEHRLGQDRCTEQPCHHPYLKGCQLPTLDKFGFPDIHTASHGSSVDRVDRAVGSRSILRLTDTGAIALVLAINEESREEGVSVRGRGEANDSSKKLHGE
jgi:hypothetical protein